MAESQVASKKRRLPQWMMTLKEHHGDGDNTDNGLTSHSKSKSAKGDVVSGSNPTPRDILDASLPFLEFRGDITYSFQDSDCAIICQDLVLRLSDIDKTVIGFDTEWPVVYGNGSKNGGPSNKTAVIQLCFSAKECYVFHVSCMLSLPKPLQSLILHKRVTLVGVKIESDLWKLERDFDIRVKPIIDRGSAVDLGRLANAKLKSMEQWSLDGLCRNVLGKRLNKDKETRCGSWSDYPLTQEQLDYACLDAYAGLLLYQSLC